VPTTGHDAHGPLALSAALRLNDFRSRSRNRGLDAAYRVPDKYTVSPPRAPAAGRCGRTRG